jgi:hypothetical protein
MSWISAVEGQAIGVESEIRPFQNYLMIYHSHHSEGPFQCVSAIQPSLFSIEYWLGTVIALLPIQHGAQRHTQ